MKKPLTRIIAAGLIALLSYFAMGCTPPKPKKSFAYEYMLSKGLEAKIAEPLSKKLKYLDNNAQEFLSLIHI